MPRTRCHMPSFVAIVIAVSLSTISLAVPRFAAAELLTGDPTPHPMDALWLPMRYPSVLSGPTFIAEHGGALILGGNFQTAGRSRALGAVKWDGTSFSRLGTRKAAFFQHMVDWNGTLVGSQGRSSTLPHEEVFTWNGAEWDSFATANGRVIALGVHGGALVAVGSFTTIGGVAANHVAFHDGTRWNPMGAGIPALPTTGNQPRVLSVGSRVYVFFVARVYMYSAGVWTEISPALNGQVNDIATDGTVLYAGGFFTKAGADSCPGIARWNGATWQRVGLDGPYSVNTVGWWNGHLIAGIADGTSRVSMLVNDHWQGLGDDMGIGVTSLYTWGSRLVARATYRPASGAVAEARVFDGVTWSNVADSWGPDMTGGSIGNSAGVVAHDRLYVSGSNHTMANQATGVVVRFIAAWDGATWGKLQSGVSGQPLSLGRFGPDLVVCGSFGVAGSSNVARWDGSSWSGFGASSPFYSWGACDHLGSLYQANDNGVLRYDGTSWVGVGATTGITAETFAVLSWNSLLVAGGLFASADNQPIAYLAAWDGLAWRTLGGGVSGQVAALATFGGDLVVGGVFDQAGGVPVSGVARWDGTQWSAMGTRALWTWSFTQLDGVLYAAGVFRHAAGDTTETVARWDGQEWQTLGSGVPAFAPFGNAFGSRGALSWVAAYHGDLYVGGTLPFAFGQVTGNLMRLPNANTVGVDDGPDVAPLMFTASPNPARGEVALSFALSKTGPARIIIHDVMGREVARPLDATLPAGRHAVAWNGAVPPGLYFARLVTAAGTRTTRLVRVAP